MIKVKINRSRPTLDNIAAALASDFTAAIYSAIGNKNVVGLFEGDNLDDVLDQYFDRQGMGETLNRMSSTRIVVNAALDISGSMFSSNRSGHIHKAATAMLVLHKAFSIISQSLPSNVFDHNIWLWAMGWSGMDCACLTRPHLGTRSLAITDAEVVLRGLIEGHRAPNWVGGGTDLAPLVTKLQEFEYNESAATHRLDIIVTDGAIGDRVAAENAQQLRGTDRLYSVILNISGWQPKVPYGFLAYQTNITDMEDIIRGFLFDFVSTI